LRTEVQGSPQSRGMLERRSPLPALCRICHLFQTAYLLFACVLLYVPQYNCSISVFLNPWSTQYHMLFLGNLENT
jgi:hypothetical protein